MRKMSYNESLQFCNNILEANKYSIKGYYDIQQLSKIYGSSVEYKGNFNIFFQIFEKCKINHSDIINIINNLSIDLAYGYCCAAAYINYPFTSKLHILYYHLISNRALLDQIKLNDSESLYRQYFHINFQKVIKNEDYLYDILFNKINYNINNKIYIDSYKRVLTDKYSLDNINLVYLSVCDLINILFVYTFSNNAIADCLNQYFDIYNKQFVYSCYERDTIPIAVKQYLNNNISSVQLRKNFNNNTSHVLLKHNNLIDLIYPYIDDIYDRYGQKFLKKCKRGHNLYILYYIYFQKYFNDELFDILLKKLKTMASKDSQYFKHINYYINSGMCNIPKYYLDRFHAMQLLNDIK